MLYPEEKYKLIQSTHAYVNVPVRSNCFKVPNCRCHKEWWLYLFNFKAYTNIPTNQAVQLQETIKQFDNYLITNKNNHASSIKYRVNRIGSDIFFKACTVVCCKSTKQTISGKSGTCMNRSFVLRTKL